jgi:xylulokinase
MLADVLEFPLYAVDVPAASGRGAALLGASAAGLVTLADIQGPLAPSARLVAEPDPAAAAFHRERHARFRHVVSALTLTGATAGRLAGPSAGAEGAA